VSAKDRGTGKSQAITITASSGLAKEEVERLVRDAESHADEDKKRREVIEVKNQADNLAYSTEKTISENRDKLPADDVAAAEKAVEAARKASESGDREAIETAVKDLTQASHKLAEALYKATTTAGGGPGGPGAAPGEGDAGSSGGPGKGDGDVIDAEVVDKK
jgi:molecular chaperone DnaK